MVASQRRWRPSRRESALAGHEARQTGERLGKETIDRFEFDAVCVFVEPTRHREKFVGLRPARRRQRSIEHAGGGRRRAEIEKRRLITDITAPGEPAIVELGPRSTEPESDPPGASQQIKPALAPKRTAQRVGAVAHVGGLLEALFVSKLGDAIS